MAICEHGQALRALLADLPRGHETALVHVLTCEDCRECTVQRLQAVQGFAEDIEYVDFFSRLNQDLPALVEEVRHKHAEALVLSSELLAHPEPLLEIRNPRYHSPILLELLLDKSQERQVGHPEEAEKLADLAGHLAVHLRDGEIDEEDVALWNVRSSIFIGNARRLLGRWKEGEDAFTAAASFLRFTRGEGFESASFCRSLGLLRWEQGRLEEAEALLRQGARAFGELGVVTEEGASQVLLGLLCLERERLGRACRLLQGGLVVLDPNARPWLPVRATLSLALALALLDRKEEAAAVRQHAHDRMRCVDDRELLFADWLEGRICVQLGPREYAEQLLDSVRLRLLAERNLPEAVLCSLDLAVLLIEAGKADEWPRLLADTEAVFAADELGLDVIRRVANGFADSVAGRTEIPRQLMADMATTLRRVFRLRGYRMEGLPFA